MESVFDVAPLEVVLFVLLDVCDDVVELDWLEPDDAEDVLAKLDVSGEAVELVE